MNRLLTTRLLLLATLVLCVPAGARAQVHQHEHADTTQTRPMDHRTMDHGSMMSPEEMQAMMPQMMRMHERMMVDSVIHQRMAADPEMRALMIEIMGAEMDMGTMHEHMAAMSPEERQAMMSQMHERMMARMEVMPAEERQALFHRMMEAHHRLMADPAVHERMIADPEMHRTMQQMMRGDGMMRDGMGHQETDHGQMEGMDHDGADGRAQGRMEPAPMSADDARAAEAASRTADRFHAALVAGDRVAVEAVLLRNAVVLEGGQAETRSEYLGHHFGADAAFLAAVEREPRTRRTEVAGDVAWVSSTSRLTGTHEGRALDLDSAELLVLRRDTSAPDGWRIAAVHWSSGTQE